MKILALEFSTEQRSVAIANRDSQMVQVLAAAAESGGRSTRAITLIEAALAEAKVQREEIDCIAVGIGPGSYAGIRAAIALAQGWQMAKNLSTVGLSSVECIAHHAWKEKIFGKVNIIVDAQRNEFYLASYDISEATISETEKLHLVPFAEVKKRKDAGETVLGPEASFVAGRVVFPEARTLAQLAATRTDFVSADKLEPIYLRETTFVKAPPPRRIG
jgi:tRNA threonylcarbamoyl adenosine modification protein YeaZ